MQSSANPLVLAIASVVVDLATVTSIRKSPSYVLGGTNYYFEFDVAKILQTNSAPNPTQKTTTFYNTNNASYNVLNSDCHTSVGLIITYYYIDSMTGLLTQLTAGSPPVAVIDTIGSGYYATIGTRQTLEYMGLDSYAIDYPVVGGVYDRYFLTNLPSVYPTASTKTDNPIPICATDNLTMSYIPAATTNALRVVVYDQNQTVVGSAGFISITPNSTLTPRTIGAGIQQLLATTMTPANPMTAIQTGYYYSIQAGNLVAPSTFTLQGVKYMFKVVDCCANKVRLHWLNRLGGSDSYTFTNYKKISVTNNSSTAQKPLSWSPILPSTTTYDKGRFKIQQTALKQYEAESVFYDVSWGEWLSELISSPEVYMETPSGLVAVVIEDSEIVVEEYNNMVNVKITFSEANNISVQQN